MALFQQSSLLWGGPEDQPLRVPQETIQVRWRVGPKSFAASIDSTIPQCTVHFRVDWVRECRLRQDLAEGRCRDCGGLSTRCAIRPFPGGGLNCKGVHSFTAAKHRCIILV